MIALSLAVAVAAAAPVELTVSHRKVAADGGALALYRYAPPGNGVTAPPVLLVADVGFGRELFDFGGRGLARWLAARGLLVYVAELKGQGRSSPAVSLASVVTTELPALVAAIGRDREGPIDVVVQGWAGTLALAATVTELEGRVRRVVALNTPAIAEVPSVLAESFLADGGRFTELGATGDDFELLFSMGGQLPSRTLGALRSTGVRDLSPSVAASLLGWMREGELALPDGSSVRARLASYDRPTLLLLGIADGFAPPELCSPLRDVSKRAKVAVHAFSRFADAEDYSHVSMLLGTAAPKEVFPLIEDFLRAEDAR